MKPRECERIETRLSSWNHNRDQGEKKEEVYELFYKNLRIWTRCRSLLPYRSYFF